MLFDIILYILILHFKLTVLKLRLMLELISMAPQCKKVKANQDFLLFQKHDGIFWQICRKQLVLTNFAQFSLFYKI